jgi:hypothetical protein
MCTCLTKLKANIARDLAIKHNVFSGVDARWTTVKNVTVKDKLLRKTVIGVPAPQIVATYSKTTTNNTSFKKATVEYITIKPIHCCQCGKKL